ncbi:MAG: hypothetical protein ACK55Z_09910 [bacterium]
MQPRAKPSEFLKFERPEDLPKFTYEELAKFDGENGNPLRCAMNGLVREYD